MKHIDFELSILNVAGFSGIISPLITIISIFIAIHYAPWFSWTEYDLSDLGSGLDERNSKCSFIFNFGISLGSFLAMIFAVGIYSLQTEKIGKIGSAVFFMDMVAMCTVGLFPINTGINHTTATILLFALAPPAFIMLGIGFYRLEKFAIGVLSIFFGICFLIGIIIFFSFWIFSGYALLELTFAFMLAIFSISTGLTIMKLKNK